MSKGLSYFILGFALTMAIVFGLGWYLTKAEPVSAPSSTAKSDVLTKEDFTKGSSDTNGLNKNGDLPVVVTGDQLGRENPFDSY